MKALSMQSVTVALLAVAVTGIGYNTMMNHRHQMAYAIGMDMLAALEAEPTTYTTFVEDGVTWHQKCEKGHCIMATNRDDLAGPIVRKGAPGGFPTTDMSAIRALESQARQAHKAARKAESSSLNCSTTGPDSPIITGANSVVVVNGKAYAPGQNADCVPGAAKISTHGAGSPIVTGAGARVTSTVER